MDSNEEKAHNTCPSEAVPHRGLNNIENTEPVQGVPISVQPDPLEENQRLSVVVEAEKILSEVRSAKNDLDIQSELEEAERTFGDFVQALQSTSNEE